MRITDMILIFWQLMVLGLVLVSSITDKKVRLSLGIITCSLLVVHLTFEKAHWQLIPTYLSLLVTFWLLIRPTRNSPTKLSRFFKKIGLVLGTIAMIFPVTLFPMFQFDQPSGSYVVGTRSYTLFDTRRKATSADGPRDREIKLQIYYPAKTKSATMMSYRPDVAGLAQGIGRNHLYSDFLFSHYKLIKTNAYLDALPFEGAGKFPVLTFSHGMGGYNQQNTFQLVEMASHGFVIIAIEHTGDAAQSTLTNGSKLVYSQAEPLNTDMKTLAYLDKHVKQWEEDIRFTLDNLEPKITPTLNSITQMADLNRIGVMGFSFGGAAATQALLHDSRIRAGINLDGPIFGKRVDDDFSKPYLSLNSSSILNEMSVVNQSTTSEEHQRYTQELKRRSDAFKGEDSLAMTLPLANHLSFTDLAAASILVNQSETDPLELYRKINHYSLEFFNQHLQNIVVFDTNTPVIAFSD